MKSNLMRFLVVAALLGGAAGRAAACDTTGYDPNIRGAPPGSCPTGISYAPPQAIDYDVPIRKEVDVRHELSPGGASGESDSTLAVDQSRADWLNGIWTAA
jgi:hypothetical protein